MDRHEHEDMWERDQRELRIAKRRKALENRQRGRRSYPVKPPTPQGKVQETG